MLSKLKVGDKVMISKASEYYGISKNNPKAFVGVITSIYEDEDLSHYVAWSNGGTNSYNASDLIMVEEVKEKSIHDILVERSTLEVGDIVKVTHEVPSNDLGWSNCWCNSMDNAISKECIITEAPCSSGVRLGEQGNYYYYPLQSVRLVRKAPKKISVKISEDYNAVVSEDNIKVGCQTITFTAFDELAAAVAKMRK